MTDRRTRDVLKNFFTQRLLVILLLMLQIAIYVVIVVRWSAASQVISVVMTMLSWLVTFVIAGTDKQPSYKVRWIIIVLILPIVGTAIYILLDQDMLARRVRKQLAKNQAKLRLERADDTEALADFVAANPHDLRLPLYLSSHAGYPIYELNKSRFLPTGEEFFEAMLQDLKKAERYIFLEFFIVYDGVMLSSLLEILERKVKEGVEVRFMYDDVGSLFLLPRNYPKILEAKGIQCRKFNPLRPAVTSTLNNRDHRKIVVIDGEIAYTGGLNLADEYINVVERFGYWKDAGIRLEGTAAWSFVQMFLELWETEDNASDDHRRLLPVFDHLTQIESEAGPGWVQPYADNPFDSELISDRVFLSIITQATQYIYITTPYLIVDYNILSALQLAAESGVDVRIITPKKWDKFLVHMTTRSYYEPLIKSGVRIFEFTPGFIHSKTLVADGRTAVVGTVNFDYRSLYLHFECAVVLYGTPSVDEVYSDFVNTQAVSEEMGPDSYPKGALSRMAGQVLKLFGPLM